MSKFLTFIIMTCIIYCFTYTDLFSQQLVYSPVNPSFGGNPYSAQWLLSLAQVQDKTSAPSSLSSAYNPYNKDPLQSFKDNMNSTILGQISKQIVSKMFGESEMKDGHYEFSNYSVDVKSTTNGLKIDILDSSTGNSTSMIIPYF